MGRLKRAGFEALARTPLRKYLYHRYDYSFSPRQLAYLVGCLERTSDIDGSILEVGCAFGHSTVFLNRHLDAAGDQRRYLCVDTFAGFTPADIAHEERWRGKSDAGYGDRYADATLRTFARTMANNNVTRVTAIQADVGAWLPAPDTVLSFCLIDVDLYLPVKAALETIVPLVAPGGVVVVDDCQEHHLWDGALQAYTEYVEANNLPAVVVEGQFGVIEA